MISVIVIGRNEGQRLSACLQSVRSAMGPLQYELLYVDSRSEDDSVALALAEGASVYRVADPHPTPGLGRRVGTAAAKGEWLLFLDGDMRLAPRFVSRALKTAYERGADGVCGIRDDEFMQGNAVVSRQENVFDCHALRTAPAFGGALFIRRDALVACGGWSGNTIACEEAELHARLLAAGKRILEIPVPMIIHTDAVRENRGILSVLFSRRRLGEGEAFRCALAQQSAGAYLQRERVKFAFYLLDILSLLALLCFWPIGVAPLCLFQCVQLGFFLARKQPRSFISQKLFFFAFPAGLCTYRRRSEDFEPVQASGEARA